MVISDKFRCPGENVARLENRIKDHLDQQFILLLHLFQLVNLSRSERIINEINQRRERNKESTATAVGQWTGEQVKKWTLLLITILGTKPPRKAIRWLDCGR